jgi:hypothetical protein
MAFSTQHDRNLQRRADTDAKGGLFDMVSARIREDIRPSFDEAYRRMSAEGKPGLFMLKTGSVALGSVLMADGLYHIMSAKDEQAEDLFLNNEYDRNYIRMFVGGGEVLAGSLLAYLGATKTGPKL